MRYIKQVSVIIVFVIIFLMFAGVYANGPRLDATLKSSSYLKDETIYINLGSTGSVDFVTAVNRIELTGPGAYEDFGSYTEIMNLTDQTPLSVDNDMISWNYSGFARSFYYQGTLLDPRLPYEFEITYALDGVIMPGEKIAGKSGFIQITLNTRPDHSADAYFIKNYMLQIQTSIDLELAYDISSPDALSVITGRSAVLSRTVFPGRSSSFDISFWTDSFVFDGFVISCIPLSASLLSDFDIQSISDGFGQLETAGGMITAGTIELKSGLENVSKATADLSSGLIEVGTAAKSFKTGLDSYFSSIEAVSGKALQIATALKDLEKGAHDLKDTFLIIRELTDPIFDKLLSGEQDQSTQAVSAAKKAMSDYQTGLDGFVEGLSRLASGMDSFAAGLKTLDASSPKLLDSLGMIVAGMGSVSEGLSMTAAGLVSLPNELDVLIDSQEQLTKGIGDAKDSISKIIPEAAAGSPVSFISEKNKNVNSVQFVYSSKRIEPVAEKSETGSKTVARKSFFEKFVDLFRR